MDIMEHTRGGGGRGGAANVDAHITCVSPIHPDNPLTGTQFMTLSWGLKVAGKERKLNLVTSAGSWVEGSRVQRHSLHSCQHCGAAQVNPKRDSLLIE